MQETSQNIHEIQAVNDNPTPEGNLKAHFEWPEDIADQEVKDAHFGFHKYLIGFITSKTPSDTVIALMEKREDVKDVA